MDAGAWTLIPQVGVDLVLRGPTANAHTHIHEPKQVQMPKLEAVTARFFAEPL